MSWFKNPVNKSIAISVIIIFVLFAVLIVFKATTHEEAGLLQVCWVPYSDSLEVAVYVEGIEESNGPCEGTEELVWSKKQIPITVAAVTYDEKFELMPNATERQGIEHAIKGINSQVGFALFAPIGDRTGADVLFKVGEPVDANRRKTDKKGSLGLAYTRHYRHKLHTNRSIPEHGRNTGMGVSQGLHRRDVGESRNRLFSTVVLRAIGGSLREDFLIAQHELLHVAGLAHDDDNPSSAIYPFVPNDDGFKSMAFARITDYDRRILREKYLD